MVRALLLLTCLSLAAPRLTAQQVLICVFAAQPENAADAAAIAKLLSAQMPDGTPLAAVPVSGISRKQLETEARRRGCAWIAEIRRVSGPQPTPAFDRSMSTAARGGSSTSAGLAPSPTQSLVFSLKKTGARRTLASGSASLDPPPYGIFAIGILKKIIQPQ